MKPNPMPSWIFLALLLALVLPVSLSAETETAAETTFATWDVFEVDKCASIWLIKRFVDPEAVIKLYPRGEIIREGIPFDTPDATFRRYHNLSTFEMLLRHYRIQDPGCDYLARIVHDVEINTWGKKVMAESREVIGAIQTIITNAADADEVIRESLAYFDRLYGTSGAQAPSMGAAEIRP